MLNIQPQYLSTAELFSRRLFQIPDYQRAYSWTSRERNDLFEDIENVVSRGEEGNHFMATVVCLRRGKVPLGTDVFDRLDIVDGQQRLTTLIILLNAIRLAINPQKSNNAEDKKLTKEIEELLVKPGGGDLLLLQTNHDTSHHFSDFLRTGRSEKPDAGKTLADTEILTAIKDCRDYVEKWIAQDRKLVDLIALIKNRLSFILYEISDEKLVYTVFEVLNSRGLAVSWLDRLKSILMGVAFDLKGVDNSQLIKELHNIWRDIYRQVGLQQDISKEALRFAATLKVQSAPNQLLSEQSAVDEFCKFALDAKQIREVSRWLLDVTEQCEQIKSNPRLKGITRISQVRLLVVAIWLQKNLSKEERRNLQNICEKVSFRMYGLHYIDARKCTGDYIRLAWRIINENLSAKDVQEGIKEIGKEYSIEKAIKGLRGENCYKGWGEELRYFLFRYEEYISEHNGMTLNNEQWKKIWQTDAPKSIEHIWSQSAAPEDVKHTLGNLMLLPPNLNSQLQDKRYKDKRESYRNTGLQTAIQVAKTPRWSKKAIRERERMLLEWAEREWGD